MKVSLYKVKKVIKDAGMNVLDARAAGWRASNYGYKVTDWQEDNWLVECSFVKSESASAAQRVVSVLNEAGISATIDGAYVIVAKEQL